MRSDVHLPVTFLVLLEKVFRNLYHVNPGDAIHVIADKSPICKHGSIFPNFIVFSIFFDELLNRKCHRFEFTRSQKEKCYL